MKSDKIKKMILTKGRKILAMRRKETNEAKRYKLMLELWDNYFDWQAVNLNVFDEPDLEIFEKKYKIKNEKV